MNKPNEQITIDDLNHYRSLMDQFNSLFNGHDNFKTELDKIFQLELKLINAANENEIFNPQQITLDSLIQLTDFDYLDYFNKLNGYHSMPLKGTDLVMLNIKYLQQIHSIIDQTPLSILANFVAWKAIYTYGNFLNNASRSLIFNYEQATFGLKKPVPDWKRCIRQIRSIFSMALSRLYVKDHVKLQTKSNLNEMIKNIKESFVNEEWTPATKEKIKEHLSKMNLHLIYPNFITNDTELKNYYALDQKFDNGLKWSINDNYLDTYRYVQLNKIRAKFQLLESSEFDKEKFGYENC